MEYAHRNSPKHPKGAASSPPPSRRGGSHLVTAQVTGDDRMQPRPPPGHKRRYYAWRREISPDTGNQDVRLWVPRGALVKYF